MKNLIRFFCVILLGVVASSAAATPFTENVPAPTSLPLPDDYPAAGGVVTVLTGVNGNVYFQFSNPTGAFRGFNSNGVPTQFRGNPFTVNDPISLDCGFSSCSTYFGGAIARMDVRFSAFDGDTQPGGFDEDDINLLINGFDIGSWSGVATEITSTDGETSLGTATGFGNNTFNTTWFSSTDPALLGNILSTGQTVSQVLDDDPNDNFWDFRRGNTLSNNAIETVAPGYELVKTVDGGATTFAQVGEIITYNYTVSNIGSVDIENISVVDDRIGAVACTPTTLLRTTSGATSPNTALCSATYTVTQEDVDAGELTNIAQASGDPEFGTLGPLTDTVTLTGPALTPSMTLDKVATPTTFSTVGETITYNFTVTNTGNATLSDVEVTDPRIPSLSCSTAALLPALAGTNVLTCSGTYQVTQDDIDNFINSGQTLDNTATVTANDPNDVALTPVTDTVMLDGPTADPTFTITKTPSPTTYDTDGETISYSFLITNTGNVTWPGPPTLTDALTSDEVCPAGAVAPNGTVTCTASYDITLDDLDNGSVPNTVDATITVGGVTETGQATATVTAVIETELLIEKSLASGANPITADTDELVYEYVLTNNGNARLDTFAVSDDKVAVTCPAVVLDPGQTVTCTSAVFDVQQSDVDAGGVTNTASATAETIANVVVTSDEVDLFVPATQMPELSLDKTSDPDPVPVSAFTPGASVDYVYTVTNSGNVTITDPVTITDDRFVNPIACPAGSIAPLGEIECRATYIVTPADVAAGNVVNVATASDGNVTSNSDSVTIPQAGAPGITLSKVADTTDFDDLTDTIDYTFTVTNSGDTAIVSLSPITINDPLIGAPFTCTEQPATLLPTESFSCSRTYGPVSQADIDAGQIMNTASASFAVGGVTFTSPSSSATVTSSVVPMVSLDKTGMSLRVGPFPNRFEALGEVIEYTFGVTNEGTQTLASVVVTDPLIPTLSCTVTNLAPGATDSSCTGQYTVTQDDLDAGVIVNTATAVGTGPTGLTDDATSTETMRIRPRAQTFILALDKSASQTSFSAVGETINYAIEVSNIGNLTLNNVVVTDPTLGLTCNIGTLAPLASDDSCIGSYQITQADIDASSVFNEATASATNATDVTSNVTVTGPTRTPMFTVEKTPSAATNVVVGTIVTYDHVVMNTGNVTLTDITLTDTHTSASGTQSLTFSPSNVIASLAPDTSVTLTTSYTITQGDIDLGADVTNMVNATATPPTGTTVAPASDNASVDLEDADPELSVVKTETDGTGTFTNLPATENFTFEVTNDGNVTLVGFVLTDDLTGFSCTLPDIAPDISVTTCADGSALSTTYTVVQDDIDTGALMNTVTVTNGTTQAEDTVTLSGPDQLPALDMIKTPTSGANFDMVGDDITYNYVVTNDGNISLTAPITVADDRTVVTCPVFPGGELAPNTSVTCTATYTVDQDDLNAGFVTNLATASISQPVVPSASHPNGTANIDSDQETATVNASQEPEITIAKVIEPGTPSTYSATTDSISFQFTVTNSGNVTLTDAITVTDLTIPSTLTCPASGPVTVEPGDNVTCTTTWTPDQGDIDAGSFTNEATAATTFNSAPVATDPLTPASATATAIQTPTMMMVKSLSALQDSGGNPTTVFATGTVAVYNYTITNTGNTTLTGPFTVNDNLISTVACPAGDLGPLDPPLVCTATYTVTADDVALGSVTNIATATDAAGNESPPADETIPGGADPSIDMVKTADVTTFSAVGDPIVYTYRVTNTSPGAVVAGVLVRPALENPITITDDKFPNPIACDPTADNRLEPDEVTTCTATYLVTQADLDAVEGDGAGGLTSAFVTNNAVAETTFGTVEIVSPAQTVTVNGAEAPALSVTKDVTAGNDPAAVNDTLTYTITTTNTGNQQISGITVVDPLIPTLSCTVNGTAVTSPFSLEAGLNGAGQSLICTGDYQVTQDDIDAQSLTNTATAEGSSPDGTVITQTGADDHPLVTDTGDLVVLKELTTGTPAAAFTDVGQELSFTITVTNNRTVSLENIRVTDSRVPGTCIIAGPLAPGASDDSCIFLYEVQQADIDAGSLNNVATAVGTPVTPGATDVTATDDITVFGPAFEPMLNIFKTANVTDFDEEGDEITYTYVIANVGNVTISSIPVLTDDRIPSADLVCDAVPSGSLAPTEFFSCTATYSVTQVDVDNGGVTNIATVSAPDTFNGGTVEADDTVTVPSVRAPLMTIEKEASDTSDVAAGDTITYTYTVTNTGNVTLAPVTLSDSHTSASGTSLLSIEDGGVIATIAPDQVIELEATYVVTQEDIDSGADLTNTVTATPTPPTGTTLAPVTANETVEVEAADPSLEVLKTVSNAPDPIVPGVSAVTFEVTVENDGNVSLTAPTLTDTLRRADTTLISPNPSTTFVSGDSATTGTVGVLDVDEIWVYTVSHIITQGDIDAGGVTNTVEAEATDPFGTDISDVSDTGSGTGSTPTPFVIDPEPAVIGLKTITSTTIAVDETVTFSITVQNTGNVTLNNVAVASDTLTRADNTPLTLTTAPAFVSANMGSASGSLLVNEIATYRATYVLTQDDVDAGGITNTATVTGAAPNGTTATDVTDNGAGAGSAPTVLNIPASPEISMVKTLFSGGPTYDAVDQELVFNFAVTNEGNITLTDAITIADALITDAGETITCDPTPLAPGDTLNCQGSYFVTQDDLDAGEINNSATASSDEAAPTPASMVNVPAQQNPALEMAKVADDMPAIDFFVGAIANYTYTVTNTGNVTITDPITITDNQIDTADINCPTFPTDGIAPDGTYVCTASYVVTVDDNTLTVVTNNATASDGNVTSPSVSETIPNDGTPALNTAKALFAVNGDEARTTFDSVGDILTYEFTVTNSGTVSFSNDINVIDPIIVESPITCFTSTTADPDLRSGESVTCQGTYAVTQDDLDAGEVFNEATSQTTFGVGPTLVESPAGSATTLADLDPEIELIKSVATLPVLAVDQVLTYTLTINNTGNQTLTNINATDPLLPNLVCEAATLDAGDTLTCSDTYTVTQDNIDSTTLVNTANVTAVNPQGGAVTDSAILETDMPDGDPSFTLDKEGSPDPFGAVGSAVLYTFTATNDGTVTLFDITITDDIVDPPYSCTIARLNVGANDNTCTLSYTVTQDDVDAGEIINLAEATGTDPFGTTFDTTGTDTIAGPTQEPALIAVKTASIGGTTVGSVITYTLSIENTGNVSLTPPVIVDTMTRNNGSSVSLDAPFAFVTGDTDNDNLVDVDETWFYTASYTLGQADLNAGGLSNSVVATAVAPNGTPASDTSDDGNNTDGNTDDDPTEVPIVQGPAVNTVKTILSGVPALNEIITYEIITTNTGNVTLTNPTITDTITRVDGGTAAGATTGPTLTSGNAAGIDPGEAWVWSFTYQITQDDVDAGGLDNTATAGGDDPNGDSFLDVSDNGDDTDGNTTDDVIRLTIIPVPDLTTIKSLVSVGDAPGETVEYLITVTNTGEATVSNVSLTDTMTNNDGTVLSPVTIGTPIGDPASLAVGDVLTYTVSYVLTQADIDSGDVNNTATASGTAPNGSAVSDVSDVPTGGDGSTPTPAAIAQVDTLIATKEANIPTRIAPNLFEVTFTMTLENTGNVTQTGLNLEDDLTAFVAPATLSTVGTPVISGFATGTANGGYNGTSNILLATNDTSLAPGATGTIELTIVYDVTAGQPAGSNVFSATSDRIIAAVSAATSVTIGADPDILAVKTVTPDRATVGQTVTYTMTFTNNLSTDEGNLTLVDALPVGLAYTPDSATFNGASTPQPEIQGRTLLWPDVTIAAGETVTLTVQARVIDGGLGDLVNEAFVLDPSGARVSNIAIATLRLPVEAVFDCADIIGKVFDDRNMNGYQDGVIEDQNLSDQTYYEGGKFQVAPEIIDPEHEPGLANVRLSTVTGTLVTTDEYGRFSVPCAELPEEIGTNFTLKLDTRSLPTGYQLTTENPRVIRVTAGTLARLNFGATIATVVDIDLVDSAFAPGSAEITPALRTGVDQLIAALQQDPSVLRLTYYRATESQDLARARMDNLEALIRDQWRRSGIADCPLNARSTGCSKR